jgi:hypothetical protein
MTALDERENMNTFTIPKLKKRQHYVWRKYLEPWTNNNEIDVYFKKKISIYLQD